MNPRILIIDDNASIHDDIRKVLRPPSADADELDALETLMFGTPSQAPVSHAVTFAIDSAFQGQEGLAKVVAGKEGGRPYALAFVDMRMPPGWDGLETIRHLVAADPGLQIVVCTAYADHSWQEISGVAASPDQLLVLKKPFDSVEIVQIAQAMTRKWELAREVERRMGELEAKVAERTQLLQRANDELSEQIRRSQQMEAELRVSQKLEAIGQLAAGIAHEINTPIQYVGDSVEFMRESFEELQRVVEAARGAMVELEADETRAELVASFREVEEESDADFILDEAPKALDRAHDGVARVAKIVRAMKDFSHPGQSEMQSADLNEALETTITVARNEHKYVADVVTDLTPLPPVRCLVGELNQVFLNLIVNASHAIGDVVAGTEERGTITISSRVVGEEVCISVRDTGTGIPEENLGRIFDPFFTTKEVGKGTGQGLSLAYNTVVGHHRGRLTVDSTVGEGTTFHVWIPIAGADAAAAVA